MVCSSCGKEINGEAKVCPFCGADCKAANVSNGTQTENSAGNSGNKEKSAVVEKILPFVSVVVLVIAFISPSILGEVNANSIYGILTISLGSSVVIVFIASALLYLLFQVLGGKKLSIIGFLGFLLFFVMLCSVYYRLTKRDVEIQPSIGFVLYILGLIIQLVTIFKRPKNKKVKK